MLWVIKAFLNSCLLLRSLKQESLQVNQTSERVFPPGKLLLNPGVKSTSVSAEFKNQCSTCYLWSLSAGPMDINISNPYNVSPQNSTIPTPGNTFHTGTQNILFIDMQTVRSIHWQAKKQINPEDLEGIKRLFSLDEDLSHCFLSEFNIFLQH